MTPKETAADLSTTGVMSRAPDEIARVLTMLLGRAETVRADLAGGSVTFVSRLRLVDPARAFILLDPDPNEAANEALLARPRASFRASPDTWHIEFAAAEPQRAQHEGRAAIRLRFPEILVTQQRRRHPRLEVPKVPLHFVADAGGVISFDGYMVDIGAGGIGVLQYAATITLEPGTLLKGCRIEPPGRAPVIVDLEVRYSNLIDLPDEQRAVRSGCRFVNPSAEAQTLLADYFSR